MPGGLGRGASLPRTAGRRTGRRVERDAGSTTGSGTGPPGQRPGPRPGPRRRRVAAVLRFVAATAAAALTVGGAALVGGPSAAAVIGFAVVALGLGLLVGYRRGGRTGGAVNGALPGAPARPDAEEPEARCPVAHGSDPSARTPASAPPASTEVDPSAAEDFVRLFHAEHPQAGPVRHRLEEVRREIATTGTYRHTSEELVFGAKVAWRNSARCIGRLYWRSLQVRDLRTVTDAADVARHCVDHLRSATNGGRIRPVISIFAPDTPVAPAPRIWNEQLVRYAGYRRTDGSVLGDPRYTAFTEEMVRRGWQAPYDRSGFDVLPLVVETAHEGPRLFDLPADAVQEVELAHPELPWFAELGLRWHAVPVISNSRLVIGGVSYPAAPFNGWYMGTEIGARNLGDTDRYDLVPVVAERLGLDTSEDATLWRDRALVELNRAVLHSFARDEVSITDHHTESRRFLTHLEREEQAGRSCPADWTWIVPPMSGSQTPVFHRYYDTADAMPGFVPDDDAAHRAVHGTPPAFVARDTEHAA